MEDNLVNQAVSKAMLDYFGCRTDVAGNGREALEAIAGGQYDLILMDCQMPEMDGYEATRAIREREAGSAEIAASRSSRSRPMPWKATGRLPGGGHGRLPEQTVQTG